MKSIIVITQNRDFFGAKLVHVPMLHALKKAYPEAKMTLLTPYASHRLFTEMGLADTVEVYGLNAWTVLRSFVKHKPDLIVNLRPESGALDFALLLYRGAIKISFDIAFAKYLHHHVAPTNLRIYRALNYLRLPELIGISGSKTVDFFKDKWGFIHRPDKTAPKILLVVGAGTGEWKRWGIDNFLTLAENFFEKLPSAKIGFIWGETEKPYEEKILNFQKRFEGRISPVPFNASPREITKQLETTSLVIGCDAGPTHVAQLCHVPFLSIVTDELRAGKSTSEEWNRLDYRTDVILSEPGQNIKEIPVAKVLKRALELI